MTTNTADNNGTSGPPFAAMIDAGVADAIRRSGRSALSELFIAVTDAYIRHSKLPSVPVLVNAMIAVILHCFPQRIQHRAGMFRRRILTQFTSNMPPFPRSPGRPSQDYITLAFKLYRQQKHDRDHGKIDRVNWLPIAVKCVPGFTMIRDDRKRSQQLRQLRDAVLARERRERLGLPRRKRDAYKRR